ncbi:response regulator FixJ [Ferrovibrio xuzhouensis]|uniref:Response regulator FixJ n=1 Tax=Ferrovibrio xuzhouensis TaxID=1576914 RepID=A0ABV7VF30_9PROT
MSGGRMVFIVDDDESVRESLTALLETQGLNALAFASAEAFLLGYQPIAPACAVVDIRMPGMDGLALLEHLRSRGIALPVLVMTGHGDVPLAVRAMKAGAADFIEKPYSNATLLDSIGRALAAAQAGQAVQIDPDDTRTRIAGLTPRERDILQQLVVGHPNKIIAYHLNISPRTVEIHRANVMKKMNADSLSHLVRMALGVGFTSGEGMPEAR